jgi:hypothetical protein
MQRCIVISLMKQLRVDTVLTRNELLGMAGGIKAKHVSRRLLLEGELTRCHGWDPGISCDRINDRTDYSRGNKRR